MENNETADEKLMRQAEEFVKARRGFRSHIMSYLWVNLCLVIIYFITSRGAHFWPVWCMIGWGVGLVIHGVSVYGKFPGKTLEEEVQAEYKRLKNKFETNDSKP
ncbi:MAG: 2TM domain-containing protein [Treponema sp.]|nr:2TM domain-containing protein [Treponema sp.]